MVLKLAFAPLGLFIASPGLAQFAGPDTVVGGGGAVGEVVSSDRDADGDPDLLFTRAGAIWLVVNDGAGSFGAPLQVGAGPAATGVHLADFDGDGIDDVIALSGATIYLSRGSANGTFAPGVAVANSPAGKFDVGDIDGDGDLDLVTGHQSATSPPDHLFLNDGGGAFAGSAPIGVALAWPQDIFIWDHDGDGDGDVLATNLAGMNRLVVNRGGVFVATPLANSAPGHFLSRADIDGDGLEDLHAMNYWGLGSPWFRQSAFGTFAFAGTSATSAYGNSRAVLEDLDGDGDPDLAYGSDLSNQFAWDRNDAGAFVPRPSLGTFPAPPMSPIAVDLDGDLDLDLVCVVPLAGQVVVFENLHTLGTQVCDSQPTSVSPGAELEASGSAVADRNGLALSVSLAPPGGAVLLLTGTSAATVTPPGSAGPLCLGGNLGRYNRPGELGVADAAGRVLFLPDLQTTPTSTGSTEVLAGATRTFQAWFRDTNGASTTNFTSALRIDFR